MKKVLITGASGFVGANLLKKILDDAHYEVYIILREQSNIWRIKDSLKHVKKVLFCDLKNRNQVFKMVEDVNPDIVYHIATYGGLPYQNNSIEIVESNLNATINLVDASLQYNVEYFINTGSSSEYGIKNVPMKEDSICEPVNLYGITKLAATNYCTMIGKKHSFKICTLRLFSPYGELEDSSRLYPSIVNSLREDRAPKLSNPNSVRDFIQISEVVNIYLDLLKWDISPGEIINVGSGQQRNLEEFFYNIALEMNKNISPIWGSVLPRENEPRMWQADITKLNRLREAKKYE